MNRFAKTTGLLVGLMFFVACSKGGNEAAKAATDSSSNTNANSLSNTVSATKGEGKGVVKAIDTTAKTIEISHGDIPGIMMAMRMSYPVLKAELLQNITVGDSVLFTLEKDGEDNFVITALTPIKKH